MTEGDTMVINSTCTVWESQLEDKDIIIISAEDDENITHAYLDERGVIKLQRELTTFLHRLYDERMARYKGDMEKAQEEYDRMWKPMDDYIDSKKSPD